MLWDGFRQQSAADFRTLNAAIDYVVSGTTLLGVRFTRGQRDLRTYFVGDRNVSWWLVLISIVATETRGIGRGGP